MKKQQTTKKKLRRGYYHTGTLYLTKSPLPVEYKSGWERDACLWMEANPEIVRFHYEAVVVPYFWNLRRKKVRKYFPDFLVEYASGKKVLVEIKRSDKVNTFLVQKKILAGIEYAQKMGWEFEVWTNLDKVKMIQAWVKTQTAKGA